MGVYRGYCQEVGFFGVDPEDLRVLELDLAALTALIGRGLGIPPLISAEEVVASAPLSSGFAEVRSVPDEGLLCQVPRPRGVLRSGVFSVGAAPRPHPGHPGFDHVAGSGSIANCPHGTRSSRYRM